MSTPVAVATDTLTPVPLASLRGRTAVGDVLATRGETGVTTIRDQKDDAWSDVTEVGKPIVAGSKDHGPVAQLADFLSCYEGMGAQGKAVVSIHALEALSGSVRLARLARNLLPAANVLVFEAPTADAGLSYLAWVASHASRKGASLEQIEMLLTRLQDIVHTFFIGSRLRQFHPAMSAWQSLRARLPGMHSLVTYVRPEKRFRLVSQSFRVGTGSAPPKGSHRGNSLLTPILRASADGDVDYSLLVCHVRARRLAEKVALRLAASFKYERMPTTDLSAGGRSVLPAGTVEVCLVPCADDLEKLISWTMSPRWG